MELRILTKEMPPKLKLFSQLLQQVNVNNKSFQRSLSRGSRACGKNSPQQLKFENGSEKSYSYNNVSTRMLIKRHRKYLQRMLEENKLKTTVGGADERRREVRDLFHALTINKARKRDELFIKSTGKLMISSFMYKTYLSLKAKNLVNSSGQAQDTGCGLDCDNFVLEPQTDLMNYDRSLYKNKSDADVDSQSQLSNSRLGEKLPCSELDTLKSKLGEKYRQPSDDSVKKLKQAFPAPVRLFHKVLNPVHNAGLLCYEPPIVSSHLRGFYWKAKIRLLWPRRISVAGMHPDKMAAVERAYLAACEELKNLGLIVENDDTSQPLTCDAVVDMLEQISEYGDSTVSSSKGKGFKIVLERARLKGPKHQSLSDDRCYSYMSGQLCGQWQGCQTRMEAQSRWSCYVHVGWPKPFSVRMVTPSLPSAQMVALLTAASNLKMLGLLNKTNKDVNPVALQSAVLRDASSVWGKCVESSITRDTCQPQSFTPDMDAKIFVDASNIGYGAYLMLKDSDKVNWLCESWQDQPQAYSKMIRHWNNRFCLHSTIAELFALVSAVLSWKRKLQHCRLTCYSDNQTAVSLVTSVKLMHLSGNAPCINVYDQLIHMLYTACRTHSISLDAVWIDRDHNWLADKLASGDVALFRMAVPNAVNRPSKVKRIRLHEDFLFE